MMFRGIGTALAVIALAGCGSTPPKPDLALSFAPPSAARDASSLTPAERSLRDRVQAALAARLGEQAKRLDVRVEGTSLWLTGETADGFERDLARAAAHDVPGITRVDVSGVAVR